MFDFLKGYDLESDLKMTENADFIPWDKLRGASVLVTGATGLIGYTLINLLTYMNKKNGI